MLSGSQFKDIEGGVSAAHIVNNYHLREAMSTDPAEKQRVLNWKADEAEKSTLGKSIKEKGYSPSESDAPILATQSSNVWKMPAGDKSNVILDGHHRIAYMAKHAPNAKVFRIKQI